MSRRRVVVTGMGCVSPVGNSVHESWANRIAGRGGIDDIKGFDASNLACRFAGEVKGLNLGDWISDKEARHMDRFIHLGLVAAIQAVNDSGLPTGDALSAEQADRIGCNIRSGIGGLPMIPGLPGAPGPSTPRRKPGRKSNPWHATSVPRQVCWPPIPVVSRSMNVSPCSGGS